MGLTDQRTLGAKVVKAKKYGAHAITAPRRVCVHNEETQGAKKGPFVACGCSLSFSSFELQWWVDPPAGGRGGTRTTEMIA